MLAAVLITKKLFTYIRSEYASDFCHDRKSAFNEHRPSWSFKQRQLNQAITITLRLTEDANIFLTTYPVVVFSHLSLQPLLPCTKSQQCFTTAIIPSGPAILNISNYHVVVLRRGIYSLRIANLLKILNQAASTRCGAGNKKKLSASTRS